MKNFSNIKYLRVHYVFCSVGLNIKFSVDVKKMFPIYMYAFENSYMYVHCIMGSTKNQDMCK